MNADENLTMNEGQARANDEPSSGASPSPSQVDLEKLADKVYQLMRAELRLAQARDQRSDS